jgi:ATP-dependent Clp protease ATP-binding subunit ClpA
VFERFSEEARASVALAQAEARRLGHDHIGTEHLLLGILAEGTSRAARALTAVGVTPGRCREKVVEAVGQSKDKRRDGDLELTDRARRSLERAGRLASRERRAHVEAEHVLLSVIQVEGRAGQVLRGLGVDPSRVREWIEGPEDLEPDTAGPDSDAGAPDAGAPDAAIEPAAAAEPVAALTATPRRVASRAEPTRTAPGCPNCGIALEGSLAHQGLASRGERGDLRAFVVAYCASCGTTIGVANV